MALALTQQPGTQAPGMTWMPMPPETGFKGQIPPGLERLNALDSICIHQQIDWLEVVSDWEEANRYNLINKENQHVLYCAEESEMCERQCCKGARGFILHLTDETGQEVMRVTRDFRCCAGCCWCACSTAFCAYEVTIEAPVGTIVGYARQAQSCWKDNYVMLDEDYKEMYRVEGPCCVCQGPCCKADVDWDVRPADSMQKVGCIAKTYGGWADVLTNIDNFRVDFPSDMDYKAKAVAVGCTFLLHFMYQEAKEMEGSN